MQEIVKMLFGSRIYGTHLPTSDHDYKVVFLPTAKDIVMGTVKQAYNETSKLDLTAKSSAEDVEVEFFSFKKYLDLLVEGQTVALDMLFTPEEFYLSEPHAAWKLIKDNQDKFLHSGVLSFIGYARQQANKYGIKGSRVAASRAAVELFEALIEKHGHLTKLKDVWGNIECFNQRNLEHVSIVSETMKTQPDKKFWMLEVCNRKVQEGTTLKEAHKVFKRVFDEYGKRAIEAESNENVDFKAIMHAVRVLNQAKELLTTGNITFPRPEKELLLQIRKGVLPYNQVADIIEIGMEELKTIHEKSSLPKTPDLEFTNKLIYEIYREVVISSSRSK